MQGLWKCYKTFSLNIGNSESSTCEEIGEWGGELCEDEGGGA